VNKEKWSESCDLSESEFDSESRTIKNAILVSAGTSHNGFHYTGKLLQESGSDTFNGVGSYFGHNVDKTDPRNLAALLENVRFVDGKLRGDVKYFVDADSTIAKVKEAYDQGKKDLIGMSISVNGKWSIRSVDGKVVRMVESFKRTPYTSVDIVVNPSAGGRLFESMEEDMTPEELKKLLESMTIEQIKEAKPELAEAIDAAAKVVEMEAKVADLTKKLEEATKKDPDNKILEELSKMKCGLMLESKLTEAKLPDSISKQIKSKYADKAFEESELDTEIKMLKDVIASAIKESKSTVVIGNEPEDKRRIALDMLFGVAKPEESKDVRPFSGIREAYVEHTGDIDVSGYCRIKEGIDSTSFPYLLQDSMTKRLIKDYNEIDYQWRKFATTTPVKDFKDQNLVRVGYLDDLDDVDPETADYLDIAPYSDDEVQFQINQKGNTLPVTRKTIINDDMNTLTKIVSRLGRAAARTLAKRVYVTNLEGEVSGHEGYGAAWEPKVDDSSSYFFDISARTPTANRNCVGTTTFTGAEIMATIVKLQKMVEPSPGGANRLGFAIRPGDLYLIIPVDLYDDACRINQTAMAETWASAKGWFGANNENIIVSPLLTDTDDWYLAYKPEFIEWITVGFLQGREEPEFFLADNPVVGQMFIADKMVYKVRHEYEVALIDPRGCYKHHA